MLRRKWLLILIIAIIILGGLGSVYFVVSRQSEGGARVTTDTIQRRNLEAIVSASGKIDPKKIVNISAQSMGRVTRLGVKEGDRVKAGQFLLQIDPVVAQSAVRRDEAAVAGARSALEQARVQLQSAQSNLELARQTLKRQQDLWQSGLTTRETLEKSQTDVALRESDLKAREQDIRMRQDQLRQVEAGLTTSQHSLAQSRFHAPFDGIVTRRNVEEGENVMVGTMNNAGTILLTVADMSVIEAEIEVDETDIPLVQMGQPAKITIDAMPNRTFKGHVTEIGNSPIQASGAAGAQRTATNFKVVVTLDEEVPDVRPGFTCTAEITTASRDNAVAVPIQSLIVRELVYDDKGNIVRQPRPPRKGFSFGAPSVEPTVSATTPTELLPGHKREEVEGVFVVRDGKAEFVPVKIGIAGERYFEVVGGLKEGDAVITGPFDSVRNLVDGDPVRATNTRTPSR